MLSTCLSTLSSSNCSPLIQATVSLTKTSAPGPMQSFCFYTWILCSSHNSLRGFSKCKSSPPAFVWSLLMVFHCTQNEIPHSSQGPTRPFMNCMWIFLISPPNSCLSHTSFSALHWTFEACSCHRTYALTSPSMWNIHSQMFSFLAFSCHFGVICKRSPQTFLTLHVK